MDGIGLISYLRSTYYERDVAIILISGVANERIIADAFKAGATYYLSKGSINEAFVLVVDRAIERARARRATCAGDGSKRSIPSYPSSTTSG
jgi:PleD family two-component response regulator